LADLFAITPFSSQLSVFYDVEFELGVDYSTMLRSFANALMLVCTLQQVHQLPVEYFPSDS